MKKNVSFRFALLFLPAFLFLNSCASLRVADSCSRNLTAQGIKSDSQLARFFRSHNKKISRRTIKHMARTYIAEAQAEGINSDVAFVQMCLETGFLRYGNLVTSDMNNFCGLGAMDAEHPGVRFDSVETGIRAHIQHLQAYATTEDVELKNELVDPRYGWVHKTKLAENVFDLAGQWATDTGSKLNRLLDDLEKF